MNYLRSKKGFTLVEIIVVLVIIAILAAISLPALTGYIDDANNKAAVSDGRTFLVAAQAYASEQVGTKKMTNVQVQTAITTSAGAGITKINSLTGATFSCPTSITVDVAGKVSAFELVVGSYTVEYDGSKITSSKT